MTYPLRSCTMKSPNSKSYPFIVRPRVYLGPNLFIGPGKIDLLRLVGDTHSISAAARLLDIPYKRAWLMIDSLSKGFGRPVVDAAIGGKGGGGAVLTSLGKELIDRYTALEQCMYVAASAELEALRVLVD